jgi:hypothetical protein
VSQQPDAGGHDENQQKSQHRWAPTSLFDGWGGYRHFGMRTALDRPGLNNRGLLKLKNALLDGFGCCGMLPDGMMTVAFAMASKVVIGWKR